VFEWTEDDVPPVRSPPPPPREPAATSGLQVALVLLGVVWLLAASWQVVAWSGDLLDGARDELSALGPFSTSPEWAGRVDAQRHARRLMLLSVLPTAGVLLALAWHRQVAAVLLGIGAVLGLVIGAGMYTAVTPDAPDVPERRGPWCAEYSGGDATCPGG
jgi:hypothetical protein